MQTFLFILERTFLFVGIVCLFYSYFVAPFLFFPTLKDNEKTGIKTLTLFVTPLWFMRYAKKTATEKGRKIIQSSILSGCVAVFCIIAQTIVIFSEWALEPKPEYSYFRPHKNTAKDNQSEVVKIKLNFGK